MTTLIIQAHPLEDSYSATVRRRVVTALSDGGVAFECFRLSQGERPSIDLLTTADRLILIYPTWSGGLPAVLLHWIHDVLDTGGALANVTNLTAVTSCGSSRLVNLVQGEWGKRYLKTAVRGRCATNADFDWIALYKIDRRTMAETTEHLDVVARRFGS